MPTKRKREPKRIGLPEVQAVRPYGLGIDVAKDFHAVCLSIPTGAEWKPVEFEVTNTPEALIRAKRRIRTLLAGKGIDPKELAYALESTGTYHYPIMRMWGGMPSVVNPALATSFKARKTDRIDAYKLSLLHLQGLLQPTFVPTNETEEIRLLTRLRRRLVSNRGRFLNAITTRLWQWNCADLKFTARHPRVRACIEDLAAGRFKDTTPQFENHRFVPSIVWHCCERLYFLADQVHQQLEFLEAEIKERVKGELADRLLSIPGVGPVCVATWIAEVEPITRFPKAEQLVAYCGLDPTPQISGGKQVGSKLRLGNKNLRPIMIQAGVSALAGKSLIAAKFKTKRGPFKKRACMAARFIARLMFRFSALGGSYDETKVSCDDAGGEDGSSGPDGSGDCGTTVA